MWKNESHQHTTDKESPKTDTSLKRKAYIKRGKGFSLREEVSHDYHSSNAFSLPNKTLVVEYVDLTPLKFSQFL